MKQGMRSTQARLVQAVLKGREERRGATTHSPSHSPSSSQCPPRTLPPAERLPRIPIERVEGQEGKKDGNAPESSVILALKLVLAEELVHEALCRVDVCRLGRVGRDGRGDPKELVGCAADGKEEGSESKSCVVS